MTDNELIARFMGCPEQDGYFGIHEDLQAVRWWDRYSTKSICLEDDYTVYYAFKPGDMLYDTSFDWLMPVVEKIGQLGEAWINIGHDYVELCWHPQCEKAPYADYQDWFKGAKIEAVYNAVVEFIKWYNQNN